MVARLQKTQDGYIIPLTEAMVEELCLRDGAAVEVRVAGDEAVKAEPVIEYVGRDEAIASYERSKTRFGPAYEALAK